jgi:hypothetical protein
MGTVAVKHLYRRYVHSPLTARKRNNRYFCRELVRFWYGWAAGKTMAGCGLLCQAFLPRTAQSGIAVGALGARAP